MNRHLLLAVFVSAISAAVLVVAVESWAAVRGPRELHALKAQDFVSPLSTVQAAAPFRVRELRELPPGYRLVDSALRDSPTGARNATSVILTYRGADGGLLELTEIPLNMRLDGSETVTIDGRQVQFAEYHPPDGSTTRTYMWRDDDVSLQLNVYVPETASATLVRALLERIVATTR